MDIEINKLPPLNSYLLKNIIFSMENQETTGFLDLISGEVVEVSNIHDTVVVKKSYNSKELVSLSINKNKDRFLALPTWGSIEGFKIREQFIKDIKNPIYKKALNHVFHTGRGVFRKFKEVLKENPIIERQWLEYKSKYMQAIVINWYQECEGYINLTNLDPEAEELPNDLLISDFKFTNKVSVDDILEVNEIKKTLHSKLSDIEKILVERRPSVNNLNNNINYFIAINLEDEIVAYIEWDKINEDIIEVISYGVIEEYRGLGIFSLLFDKLMRQAMREKFKKLIIFNPKFMQNFNDFIGNSIFSCNYSYSIVDILKWNQEVESSEIMDV